MTLSLRLPGEALSAREARRAVSSWAVARGLDVELDDLQLVTSELVANAASHGAGPVTVEAEDAGDFIRLRVTDSGSQPPVPRQPADHDDSGRGLLIVSALSLAWGSVVDGTATQVWAELPVIGR